MRTQKRLFNLLSAILWILGSTFVVTLGVNQASSLPPMPSSQILLDKDSNNTEVSVVRDSVLVIKLLANPGTGYSWQIVKNDPQQVQPLGDSVLEPLGEPRPGAYENQVFKFLVQGTGSTVLELHYLRPWEKDLPPAQIYRLQLNIQDP